MKRIFEIVWIPVVASIGGAGRIGWCIVAFAGLLVLAGGEGSRLPAASYGRPNALRHTGYHAENHMYVDIMDLHANGGLMAAVPYGTTYLTDGPDGDGLDFWSSSEFTNTGAVGRNDWNNNLFFGLFNAPVTGDYEFRVAFYDDRSGLWIDLDQDGVFESSVPGLGSNRGEQLSWDDIETKTVRLDAGSYMFAVTHGQGTGGSRVSVLFKTPAMTTGQAVIKPSDPAQDGLWTAIPEPVTLTILALGGLAILRRRRSC